MPTWWTPPSIWTGSSAWVLGGGSSLRDFDFTLLRGRHVVGCNGAVALGPEIVPVLFFGDAAWWQPHRSALAEYARSGGLVVTSAAIPDPPAWVHRMQRQSGGLGTGDALAWHSSSGASALNLAVSLGATRVYLLGVDLDGRDGRHHWYDEQRPEHDCVYRRFADGYRQLLCALRAQRPDVSVVHVTDGQLIEGAEREVPALHLMALRRGDI